MSILDIGPHRVRHGDVMDTDGIPKLMGPDRAAIMYSDPPWGTGNLRYWATMNRKMTGDEVRPAELDAFLEQIFWIASAFVDDFLLIEYGIRWRGMIQKRGTAAGFHPCGVAGLLYRGGSRMLPLDLHVFTRGKARLPERLLEALEATTGYESVRTAIGALAARYRNVEPSPIILDPCCGMGYTAQAAIDFGLRFRGNELNRVRLDKTIRRLR